MTRTSRPRAAALLPSPRLRGWMALGVLAAAAALTTCTDDTGPGRPLPGYVALAPRFVAEDAGIVPVAAGSLDSSQRRTAVGW